MPGRTWKAVCEQRWIDDDHLSLVATMRRPWIAKLGKAGITTLEGLALAQLEVIEGIRPEIFERIRLANLLCRLVEVARNRPKGPSCEVASDLLPDC